MFRIKGITSCLLLVPLALVFGTGATAGDKPPSVTELDMVTPQVGHPLFGTLKGATNLYVYFDLDSGPSVTLTWENIAELQINHKVMLRSTTALLAAGRSKALVLETATIRAGLTDLTIVSGSQTVTIPIMNVASVSNLPTAEQSSEAKSVAWTASILGNGSLTTGTQSQQMLGARIGIRREQNLTAADWHHQMTTLILDASNNLTKQSGQPSTRIDEYDGVFSHAVYITKSVYADVLAAGYHNSSLNLYLQQSYGGGLGKAIDIGNNQMLELSANFLFIGEHFYGSVPSVGFAGASLTERYSIRLPKVAQGLELVQGLSYIPAFNQDKAWQIRGTATLIVPLTTALSAILNFSDNYMENAPNGRKNYSSSSFGIGYTFPPPPPPEPPPFGACILPDPNGGPPRCVQLDLTNCGNVMGTYLGGSCALSPEALSRK